MSSAAIAALKSSELHKVLVFVNQKQVADELATVLQQEGFAADSMHGGKSQTNRLWVLDEFRKGALRLLVCTDVLGRGIDLPDVSHVVIYEMGLIEDYIHRIGRTGRGPHGKGHALVFFEFWERSPEIASELIEVLQASSQSIPEELKRIAAEVASGKRGWSGTNGWSRGGGRSWSKWEGGQAGGAGWWSAGGRNGDSSKGRWEADGEREPASQEHGKAAYAGKKKENGAFRRERENGAKPPKRPAVSQEVPDSWDE